MASCLICNGQLASSPKRASNLQQCKSCNYGYLSPDGSQSEIWSNYKKNLFSTSEYYAANFLGDRRDFQWRLKQLLRYKSSGQLLDLGCGRGVFLQIASDAGFQVTGVDLNPVSLAEAARVKDAKLHMTAVENLSFEPESFDVICLNDLIEHLVDPRIILKLANNWLKKGGVIMISTPDFGSFMSRVFGDRWLHLKPVEHIHYFSRGGLRHFLALHGFSELLIESLPRTRLFATIVEKGAAYSQLLSELLRILLSLTKLDDVLVSINSRDEMLFFAAKS